MDEAYKDGSGSEHGIYQVYKLAAAAVAVVITILVLDQRKQKQQ